MVSRVNSEEFAIVASIGLRGNILSIDFMELLSCEYVIGRSMCCRNFSLFHESRVLSSKSRRSKVTSPICCVYFLGILAV